MPGSQGYPIKTFIWPKMWIIIIILLLLENYLIIIIITIIFIIIIITIIIIIIIIIQDITEEAVERGAFGSPTLFFMQG